jgi:hypothetical protein
MLPGSTAQLVICSRSSRARVHNEAPAQALSRALKLILVEMREKRRGI